MATNQGTTRKLCVRCKATERLDDGSYCRECKRRNAREWSAKNPEKRRAATQRAKNKRTEAQKEAIRVRNRRASKRFYATLDERWAPEQVAAYRAKRNTECAAWRAKHPDYAPIYMAAYRKTEKALVANAVGQQQAKAKKYGAPGEITVEQWLAKIVEHGTCCFYCKKPFTETRRAAMDHLTPMSRRGSHTLENVVPACKPCNSQKRDRTLAEYLALLKEKAGYTP